MEFRPYQDAAIQSIFDYFDEPTPKKSKGRNPIVAMPTGTGKSVVIAGFATRALHMFPQCRIMILTHVKELIRQNSEKLSLVWPNAPFGIYSAGLKKRESSNPIVFGGIATVHDNEDAFGEIHLVLIDECHLLSPNTATMYQQTIERLKKKNPFLKVCGFTATPYRIGQGALTDEGLFTDICYDITGVESFNRLIAEGYLSPLFPLRTQITLDVNGIKLGYDGDYDKEALETATLKMMWQGMQEFVQYGWNRKCWMVFVPNVKSAEAGAEMLRALGVSATCVHGGNKEFSLTQKESDQRLADFKAGKYKAIVNANKLTTGFDHPPIDLIGMFRASTSTGLWVQMLGRGTRPFDWFRLKASERAQYAAYEGFVKQNCLVADFAGNTRRLGPINDPIKPRKPGDKGGDAPVRICDNCGIYNPASARFCMACGLEFPRETKLVSAASDAPLIANDVPELEWFDVKFVIYRRHEKANKPSSVAVSYQTGLLSKPYRKWICPEHTGLARKEFVDWWRKVANTAATDEPPKSVDEFIVRQNELKMVKRIKVWTNAPGFPQVMNDEY
jgi:DNA repair protein RadD